jgi:hypothetical protein
MGEIMRSLHLAALLLLFISPSATYAQQDKAQQNQHGASVSANPCPPVNVTISQPTAEPQRDTSKTQTTNRYEWFWPPMWSNWALVIIAAITARAAIRNLGAIEDQVSEMRKTGSQTEQLIRENIAQSKSMTESVQEAARSATAMEGVAASLEITAGASQKAAEVGQKTVEGLRQQMRAWLTVTINAGVAQDRSQGLKFDARPLIVNTGLTPARDVRCQIRADIFPVPLASNFQFPPTEEGKSEAAGNFIGAHQTAGMHGVVPDFAPDQEAEQIKIGIGKAVFAWGTVFYEDVLGGPPHKTKFCHQISWDADGRVSGYYIAGENDGS